MGGERIDLDAAGQGRRERYAVAEEMIERWVKHRNYYRRLLRFPCCRIIRRGHSGSGPAPAR